jgi:hypothetical protein
MAALPLLAVPDGAKSVAVFDTNAYRNLSFGLSLADARARAVRLRELERAAGAAALASPIVIWELLAHLADTADPAYSHCVNALVALGEHTRERGGGGICMALDSEWVVCHTLFDKEPAGASANVSNLAALTNHVRDHAPAITDAAALSNIKVFAVEMAKREASWLSDIQTSLNELDSAASHQPGKTKKDAQRDLRKYLASPTFELLWASVAIGHFAQLVGVSLNPQELASRAEFFKNHFSVPFRLILTLFQSLMGQSGLNLTSAKRKRGNFMWDAGICYLIPTAAAAGVTMEMVTGDQAIAAAATAAQSGKAVVKLEDYLQRIGFP